MNAHHRRAVYLATASTLLALPMARAQLIPAGQGKVWNATYANEFNIGAADLNGYSYDVGNAGGWGNSELQVYTAPPGAPPPVNNPNGGLGQYTTTPTGINSNNVYVQDGNLNIAVIATGSGGQSYTSGRIKTRSLFSQTYGLFEFRARVPAGQGLWPAVWMMSKDETYGGWPTSGELDLLETKGQETGLVQGSIHSGANPGAHQTQTRTFQQSGLRPPGFTTTEFHTYSFQWTAGSVNVAATMKWYVDGVNYYTQQGGWFIPSGVPSTNDDAPFDKPFYFLINMAVGGNYVGAPNIPNGTYVMQLDYLRAYSISLRPTWKNDQSGTWSDTTKWTDSISPNTAGADVLFGSAITQPRTVTVDSPKTIGRMTFDNSSAYTIGGAQTLTLNGGGGVSQINVLNGSHTVSSPLFLQTSTAVTVTPPASTLVLSGSLSSAAGTTLTKSGAGKVQIKHIRGGNVSVDAGSIHVLSGAGNAGASKVESIAITTASGASFDLNDNTMIVDYTGSSHITAIKALIASAYTGGTWNGPGLTSSAARTSATGGPGVPFTALGYAEASDLGVAEFAGLPVDSTSVLVKHTYAGDATLDGEVDVADLGLLASNWQMAGMWHDGDFDYNGTVDVNDLGLLASNWQAGVGNPLTPTAGPWALADALASLGLPAPVPEPNLVALASLGLTLLSVRKNRHGPPRVRRPVP
jgi:beta-glucanase (GH16 family)